MHTLYGYQGSGSAIVEAALLIAGLPFRTVDAASWDDASAMEELRGVNPLGQIPTLVLPDGTVLSESANLGALTATTAPCAALADEVVLAISVWASNPSFNGVVPSMPPSPL